MRLGLSRRGDQTEKAGVTGRVQRTAATTHDVSVDSQRVGRDGLLCVAERRRSLRQASGIIWGVGDVREGVEIYGSPGKCLVLME